MGGQPLDVMISFSVTKICIYQKILYESGRYRWGVRGSKEPRSNCDCPLDQFHQSRNKFFMFIDLNFLFFTFPSTPGVHYSDNPVDHSFHFKKW